MKKISIIASVLLLSSSMLSADITVKTDWQLLGATQDMNTTMFNDTCVDYIWKYDTSTATPEWQIHIANGLDYAHSMTTISSFTKGEGYWLKGNADCVIPLAEPITSITHNNVTYGFVTSPFTDRVWLDKNLGASQVCTALDDSACYGDYYQWGRAADGHEKLTSSETNTLATTITEAGSSFISGSADWTTADTNGTLRAAEWSKTDGASICPIGYRVPTITEIAAETTLASTAVTNGTDAYNNFLKISSPGYRITGNSTTYAGGIGYYWTTTLDSNDVPEIYKINGLSGDFRANGFSVRCIKD